MKIQMQVGIGREDKEVLDVVKQAQVWKVIPDVQVIKGKEYQFIEIYLYDGENKSCSIPDHIFDVMSGVSQVSRITPPEISLKHNGVSGYKIIDLGDNIKVGTGLPCRLIFGPCTVDRYIESVISDISDCGVKMVRGGCWKPRSSPYSFPGHGGKGLMWYLDACAKNDIKVAFLEIMESSDIELVRKTQAAVGYKGKIVLWVGARTCNTRLLRALGSQKEYPVMLKHSLSSLGPDDFISDTEWVTNGPVEFDDDGKIVMVESCHTGNTDVMLCLRGIDTGRSDQKPWRASTNWDWTEYIQQNWWSPVVIDPSHAAGTMKGDLVFTAIKSALTHKPSMLLIEGGYPSSGYNNNGYKGLCDMNQSVSLERLGEVIELVREHNIKNYDEDLF